MKHKMNAADGITASRIVFAVCVLLCPAFSVPFYVFYLLGALTDMLDGRVARWLELQSPFGARLDTIADYIFVLAVLAKALPAIYVPSWLWLWLAVIALIKLTNLASSLVLYHRLVPMHTVLNKVTGFLLFLLPFGVGRGPWQTLAIAVIAACSTATLAAIQEGHYIRSGKEIDGAAGE